MAEMNKILYIVVIDDENDAARRENVRGESESFRYTRPVLQSTLQLIGCKSRHAFKISKRVFGILTSQSSRDPTSRMRVFVADVSIRGTKGQDPSSTTNYLAKPKDCSGLGSPNDGGSKKLSSESYKRRTTVTIFRTKFLDVVCEALAEYKYVGPKQRADLILACRLRERKESVTVLLCGTSGCGKSTLSSLLAGRLGITTVISTDSIRHMMRSFVDEKQDKLLWASTYHAGECLDPVAVAEAKARRKARKKAGIPKSFSRDILSDCAPSEKHDTQKVEVVANNIELIRPKQMAVEGFKAQSEMVIESLHRLITTWEERKESVIVEGVHLSLNFVMGLMKKHPSIVPFMVYITNEDKHLERFAVRAKYMTLDPEKNKYVKYIRNIRRIQEYLCNRADKHLVPKINNTNVDKSVATIHATLFGCLRRREAREPLYDATTNTVSVVYEEYRNQCVADSFGSKGMYQLIQRKGSSRRLMALIGDDGHVAKAWPVGSYDNPALGHGSKSGMGTPMYGPLVIDKAEPVNLQFGHFGLSAWPKDTGSASYASSFDESRTEWTGTETGSRCYSSCCSSPRMSDRPSKQHKEELSVSGSDEEVDDPNDAETDDDVSDKHNHGEIEGGSVDEGSIKSDEDDQMHDDLENGYSYYDDDDDDNDEFRERLLSTSGNLSAFLHNNSNNRRMEIFPPTLDMFLRTQSDPFRLLNDSHSPTLSEKTEKKMKTPSVDLMMMTRSLSIPPNSNDNNSSADP